MKDLKENKVNLETLSNDYLALCQKVGEFDKDAMDWMLNEAHKLKRFSDSDSLDQAFVWWSTPQGHEFWRNMSENLVKSKKFN